MILHNNSFVYIIDHKLVNPIVSVIFKFLRRYVSTRKTVNVKWLLSIN